ncbi:SEC1 family transport protein SLY1, partial [Tetrabaena socialis]
MVPTHPTPLRPYLPDSTSGCNDCSTSTRGRRAAASGRSTAPPPPPSPAAAMRPPCPARPAAAAATRLSRACSLSSSMEAACGSPAAAPSSSIRSITSTRLRQLVLDKHTNIATSLLGAIKMRALDQYFNTAEDLLVGKADLQAVLKLLQSGKGAPMDKLRLAIIYILAYDGLPSDHELSELENIMRTGGADVTALQYVRTLKRNNLTGSGGKGGGGAEAMGHHAGAPAASQTNLLDWADKTFGQGLSQVAKGVKTL